MSLKAEPKLVIVGQKIRLMKVRSIIVAPLAGHVPFVSTQIKKEFNCAIKTSIVI